MRRWWDRIHLGCRRLQILGQPLVWSFSKATNFIRLTRGRGVIRICSERNIWLTGIANCWLPVSRTRKTCLLSLGCLTCAGINGYRFCEKFGRHHVATAVGSICQSCFAFPGTLSVCVRMRFSPAISSRGTFYNSQKWEGLYLHVAVFVLPEVWRSLGLAEEVGSVVVRAPPQRLQPDSLFEK